MSDVKRALIKQEEAELDASFGSSLHRHEAGAAFGLHIRSQMALARDAIEEADRFLNEFLNFEMCTPGALQNALQNWADYVNGDLK